MPDTPETPETPTPETTPPATPTAEYVSKVDFERIIAENRAAYQAAREEDRRLFQQILESSQRPAAPAQPAATDMTTWSDEQLQEAVDRGELSVAKMTRVITERATKHLESTRLDRLEQVGSQQIGSLSMAVAQGMTYGDDAPEALRGKPMMPHYKRYEKEIKDVLATYPKGTVLTTEHIQGAYRYVIGGHAEELAAEREEQAIRRASAPKPEPGVTTGRGGRTVTSGRDEMPAPAELFGTEYMKALGEKGDVDAWCKKLGYKGGYKEYAALALAQQNEVA